MGIRALREIRGGPGKLETSEDIKSTTGPIKSWLCSSPAAAFARISAADAHCNIFGDGFRTATRLRWVPAAVPDIHVPTQHRYFAIYDQLRGTTASHGPRFNGPPRVGRSYRGECRVDRSGI